MIGTVGCRSTTSVTERAGTLRIVRRSHAPGESRDVVTHTCPLLRHIVAPVGWKHRAKVTHLGISGFSEVTVHADARRPVNNGIARGIPFRIEILLTK